MVQLVFKNNRQICAVLRGLAVGHRGSMAVRGGSVVDDFFFLGFVHQSP